MSSCSFEGSEINLYSKLYKEFTAKEKNNLITHIENKIKPRENIFYYFILIKYKDTIVDSFKGNVKEIKTLNSLKEVIDKKIENVEEGIEDIKFKIFILEESKKDIIKKINKEFCLLNKQLNPDKNKKSLENYIYKNKLYIFSSGILLLTLALVNKLNGLGIITGFLPIDTLTLIINSFIYYFVLFFGGIFIIAYLYARGGLFLQNFFFKLDCSEIFQPPKRTLKNIISGALLTYMFIISVFIIVEYIDRENSIFKLLVTSYITQTREPSIREIKYNGDENKKNIIDG